MANSSIDNQITKLKVQFEIQLDWGDSMAWSKYDFEKLSEQIAEKTGVSLSTSTLKRIFGKVSYKSDPSLTTLNTLSQFLNYIDWRDFLIKNPKLTTKNPKKEKRKWVLNKYLKIITIFCIFIFLITVSLGIPEFFFSSDKRKYNSDDFNFSSKTMLTYGLPNSVIFSFDASKANNKDSIFICQTWDTRRKVLVNKNDKYYSSIYYYPGFYRAKLMIGNKIIKEHDIQINTKGWLGLIEADWNVEPLYFKQSDIMSPKAVVVSKELLDKYNLKLTPSLPKVRLFNQKIFKGIMTNHFTFETELKNGYGEGANSCQRIEVLIQAKNDILIVPIVSRGCVGDIYLAAFGFYTHSYKEDLSSFGCNPIEWTKLKVECRSGLMKFYINSKQVYSTQILNKPTEIVGVQYRFNGTGAVRNTWLKGSTDKVQL